jgi:predicted phosphate transport protein (TIGR00153 family)
MLGWFQALMPQEHRFFAMFSRHADIMVAGAEALRCLLQGGDDVPRYCQEIVARENDADEVTRQVLTAVRRTFITPFDRGDIKDLISSMDDAIDQMNKCAKVVGLFEIRTFEDPMREMGDVILKSAELTREAVPLLSSIGTNAGKINVLTEKMVHFEERADQLHDIGRKQLFTAFKDKNPMAFVIGTEVYDHLEKVVDRFEDVANEMSAIVIDHL